MDKEKYQRNIDALKILLDFSWQKYIKQNQYFESLDSKSATMVLFVGLLFSIITGFIYYLLAETNILSFSDKLITTFIFIILSSFLMLSITISFYLSLTALGIRKIDDPAKISDAKKFFQKNESVEKRFQRKLIIYIIKSLENAEKSFRIANLDKSHKIKLMTNWLKIATVLVIINIIYVLVIV